MSGLSAGPADFAMAYARPLPHSFICCDADHGSSSSTSSNSSTSSTSLTTLSAPKHQSAPIFPSHTAPSGLCDGTCSVQQSPCGRQTCSSDAWPCDVQCRGDQSCPGEGTVECCGDSGCSSDEKPSCDDCGLSELEKWACSKEGCHAIQQYLECCTQTNCDLPCAPAPQADLPACNHPVQAHHHYVPFPTHHMPVQAVPQIDWQTPLTTPCFAGMYQQPLVPSHICHWQNCHQIFRSMPDLLAHVASDHLGAPGFSAAPPVETLLLSTQPLQVMSQTTIDYPAITAQPATDPLPPTTYLSQSSVETELLSCLWDDCFPLPADCSADPFEACPSHPLLQDDHVLTHNHNHTTTAGEPFSPQTMLRHVLEEHLGVPGQILGWGPEMPDLTIPPQKQMAVERVHKQLHQPSHHHHRQHTHLPTPSPSSLVASSPSPPPDKLLTCQWVGCDCLEAFGSPAEFMAHVSEAHVGKGQDSYVCLFGDCADDGGRVFRSRQKVLRHLQSHTGHRPFVCGVCQQSFSEAAPLAAHTRRHAKEKPFKCDHPGCGKEFAISSSLTIHMRTHNGEKPFVCPHCQKGFVEASNLTKHIRTHTGERPFACPLPGCGKRFPRPDQLKRHMGVHDATPRKENKRKRELGTAVA